MPCIKLIVWSCISLIAFPLGAYTYTLENKSNKEAEFQFQLAADITTNYKTETVKVPANGTAQLTIPEWYRAGLCVNLSSIKIRFLPNGEFKKPLVVNPGPFDNTVLPTGEVPRNATNCERSSKSTSTEGLAKECPGLDEHLYCFDTTFTFTSSNDGYPLLKWKPW